MSLTDSFEHIMQRLHRGDPQAATEIFERYARRLIGLARARLDRKLQQRVDAEEIMNSVLKSFFVRQRDGQMDLKDWDSLWGLLVVLTLRKCIREHRRFRRVSRDIRREVTAEELWDAVSREPTPEQAAALADTVAYLLEGMDGVPQQVLILRLQGDTIPEISTQVQRTERTVQRILQQVRQKLDRLADRETAQTSSPVPG